jgi:hypothetical protein
MMTAVLVVGATAVGFGQAFYGGYGIYGGGHASTAAEGFQRGFADVVRSAGQYNLLTSEAAINYEEARSKHLDNRLKATETYFEMRRINKSYRDSQRKARPSNEQLQRIAAMGRPDRLAPTELDPVSGTINWPLILRDEAYRSLTAKLQDQFAQRAERSGVIGHEAYQAIQQTVDEGLALLRSNAESYRPNDYLQAKKFLESLATEARYPIG